MLHNQTLCTNGKTDLVTLSNHHWCTYLLRVQEAQTAVGLFGKPAVCRVPWETHTRNRACSQMQLCRQMTWQAAM